VVGIIHSSMVVLFAVTENVNVSSGETFDQNELDKL